MNTSAHVLVADDEPNLRRVLEVRLRREGCDVLTVASGAGALEAMESHHFDLLITDLRMPNMDGMTLLKHVQNQRHPVPVVVLTAHGSVDTAVAALKAGALDYIAKPFEVEELRRVLKKALASGRVSRTSLPNDLGRHDLIGRSSAMARVYDMVDRVAGTKSTALVTGESGTGKELIARALHTGSDRADGPYIRLNCAAIPAELFESELFGHERGAFTGATSMKPGRFELADGGTLFLDEIGEIPMAIQSKLLRVLQESEFERVGGVNTHEVNVRVVAATNRDLRAEIDSGSFREDLFYRLNVVEIALPPLRERRDDVLLLANHFLQTLSAQHEIAHPTLSDAAASVLSAYGWPGNVRELENTIERSLLFVGDDGVIRVDDLPDSLRSATPTTPDLTPESTDPVDERGLKEIVKAATSKLERHIIEQALSATNHNVTQAAKRLKISRKSLQTKMKELGLREARIPSS